MSSSAARSKRAVKMFVLGAMLYASAELLVAELIAATGAAMLVSLWDFRNCRRADAVE